MFILLCIVVIIGVLLSITMRRLKDINRRVHKLEEQVNEPGSLNVVNYEDSSIK